MISCVPILPLLIRNHSSATLCLRLIVKHHQNTGLGSLIYLRLHVAAMIAMVFLCCFKEMMRYTRRQLQHQQRQQQSHRRQQPAKRPNDHCVGRKQDDHCAEEDHNTNITMMTKTMTMIMSKNE